MTFNHNGVFNKEFINNLKNPNSLGETSSGCLVVIEIVSRSVIIYTADGIQLNQFSLHSELDVPAFMTIGSVWDNVASKVDVVYISDWKKCVVQAYELNGEMLWSHVSKSKACSKSDKSPASILTSRSSVPSSQLSPLLDKSIQANVFQQGHTRTGSDSSFFDATKLTLSRTNSGSSLQSFRSSRNYISSNNSLSHTMPPLDSSVMNTSISLRQPQGLCLDQYGHLLVADGQGAKIVVLSGHTGEVLAELTDQSKQKINLPMCMTLQPDNTLNVLLYTGILKRFKYLDHKTPTILPLSDFVVDPKSTYAEENVHCESKC